MVDIKYEKIGILSCTINGSISSDFSGVGAIHYGKNSKDLNFNNIYDTQILSYHSTDSRMEKFKGIESNPTRFYIVDALGVPISDNEKSQVLLFRNKEIMNDISLACFDFDVEQNLLFSNNKHIPTTSQDYVWRSSYIVYPYSDKQFDQSSYRHLYSYEGVCEIDADNFAEQTIPYNFFYYSEKDIMIYTGNVYNEETKEYSPIISIINDFSSGNTQSDIYQFTYYNFPSDDILSPQADIPSTDDSESFINCKCFNTLACDINDNNNLIINLKVYYLIHFIDPVLEKSFYKIHSPRNRRELYTLVSYDHNQNLNILY